MFCNIILKHHLINIRFTNVQHNNYHWNIIVEQSFGLEHTGYQSKHIQTKLQTVPKSPAVGVWVHGTSTVHGDGNLLKWYCWCTKPLHQNEISENISKFRYLTSPDAISCCIKRWVALIASHFTLQTLQELNKQLSPEKVLGKSTHERLLVATASLLDGKPSIYRWGVYTIL